MATYHNLFKNPRLLSTGDMSEWFGNPNPPTHVTLPHGDVGLPPLGAGGSVDTAIKINLISSTPPYLLWGFRPPAAGDYKVRFWACPSDPTQTLTFRQNIYKVWSGGTPVHTITIGPGWTEISEAFSVVADDIIGNDVQIYIDGAEGAVTGGEILFTASIASLQAEDHTYFDGTWSGASWDGTPHASKSTLVEETPPAVAEAVPYRGTQRLTLHPLEETRGKLIASPLQLTNENPWWGIRAKEFKAESPAIRQQLLQRGDIPGSEPVFTTYENREISLGVRALPADIGEDDVTNLWPNPKGAYGLDGLTLSDVGEYVASILCEDPHKDSFSPGLIPDANYPVSGLRAIPEAGAESCFVFQGAIGESFFAQMELVSGEEYTFSAYVTQPLLPESGSPVRLYVESTFGISEGVGTLPISATGDEWDRVAITVTANVTGLHNFGFKRTAGGTDPWFITGFSVTHSGELLHYVDGDTPGATWAGVPHNSASTLPADLTIRLTQLVTDVQHACSYVQSGRPGATLRHILPSGRRVFFDLVSAEYTPKLDKGFIRSSFDEIEIRLSAKPFARGRRTYPETTPAPTFSPACRVLQIEGVEGDAPAPATIEITSGGSVDDAQQAVLWGSDSRAAEPLDASDISNGLFIPASSLLPISPWVTANAPLANGLAAGAGTGITGLAKLAGSFWHPAVNLQLSDFSPLRHVGRFRVFARVNFGGTQTGKTASCRLVWRVGASGAYTENPAATWTDYQPTESNGWYLLDLGLIDIPKSPIGTHSWDGQLQVQNNAAAGTASTKFSVHQLYLFPTEASGRAVALPPSPTPQGLIGLDSLLSSASTALNARAQQVGANWATSGSATDFFTATAGATRSTALAENPGRLALSAVPTGVAWASIEVSTAGILKAGITHRYTTSFATAWRAEVDNVGQPSGQGRLIVYINNVAVTTVTGLDLAANTFYTLAGFVDQQGRWAVYWVRAGFSLGSPIARGHREILSQYPAGQSLASGSSGFYDVGTTAGTLRTYRNWALYSAMPEYFVGPNGDLAQIGPEGAYRHTAALYAPNPTTWAEAGKYEGDLPRLGAGTKAKNTTRLMVRICRHDPTAMPDSGADSDSATVTVSYIPQYLHLPTS